MIESTKPSRKLKVVFFGFFLFFLPLLTQADNPPYSRVIAFGDSLVDAGNDPALTFLQRLPDGQLAPGLVIPPPTRYDRGRFSNGPNVADYLAAMTPFTGIIKPSVTGFDLMRDNVSFGYGGSETGIENLTPGLFPVPGLLGQISQFEDSLKNSSYRVTFDDTLFVIWTGANDYMNHLLPGEQINPETTVNNIVGAVQRLTELGAKKIIVFNLPDLGSTPICQNYGVCSTLSEFTVIHNNLLRNSLRYKPNVYVYDTYAVFDKIQMDPTSFRFSEEVAAGPAAGCLFQALSEFDISNCSPVDFDSNSFYWDEIHPSTRVHKIVAKVLIRKLD